MTPKRRVTPDEKIGDQPMAVVDRPSTNAVFTICHGGRGRYARFCTILSNHQKTNIKGSTPKIGRQEKQRSTKADSAS